MGQFKEMMLPNRRQTVGGLSMQDCRFAKDRSRSDPESIAWEFYTFLLCIERRRLQYMTCNQSNKRKVQEICKFVAQPLKQGRRV